MKKKRTPLKNKNITKSLQIKQQPEKIFTLLYKIGKGKTNTIYKAIHKYSRQIYAIKIINNISDNNTILSYYKTFYSIKNIINKSEYIIKYYNLYYSKKLKSLWLILEYCSLGNILNYFWSIKRLNNESDISTIISMTLKGLKYLYDNKIQYKTLKINNIIITEDGFCKLNNINFLDNDNEVKYENDAFNIGIICLELIYGEKINNFEGKKISELLLNDIKINQKYSSDFIDFLEVCLNNYDKNYNKTDIFEVLLKHDFIVKNSKDSNYLCELIIQNNKNRKNIIYQYHNKLYGNKDINRNNTINDFFHIENKKNKYKLKEFYTESSLVKLKQYIYNKDNIDTKKNIRYNSDYEKLLYNYLINKNNLLLIQNEIKQIQDNYIKGIYLSRNSFYNTEIKTYNITNEENNTNRKCEIIQLTPTYNKYSINTNIKTISIDQPSLLKTKSHLIENDISLKEKLLMLKNRERTYSKPLIRKKEFLFKKFSSIKTYRINRKLKKYTIEGNDDDNDNNKINRKLFVNKNNDNNKVYKTADDNKYYYNTIISDYEKTITNLNDSEIINEARKTNKMYKSHEKYFNYVTI